MSQVIMWGARINSKGTPETVVRKVVGDEIVRQIRREAAHEVRGELERARVIEEKYRKLMPEHEEAVMRKVKRKSLIRRVAAPIEMAWAFVYACAALWPVAIAYKLIAWAQRKGYVTQEDK